MQPPSSHKRITVHIVYDVKYDGCYKAHLVAVRHLIGPPLHSVYFGVVSLRSFRIVIFFAELNGFYFVVQALVMHT